MSTVTWVIFIVIAAIVLPLSGVPAAPQGPGPQVRWVPRSMRPAVNRRYERRGWQRPFSDDGSRNSDRSVV